MRSASIFPAPVAAAAHSARLRSGADPVGINGRHGTRLHRAADNGSGSGLRLLLAAGVDLNTNDIFGNTPLHASVVSGSVQVMRQLLVAGVELNARDEYGFTALRWAVILDDLDKTALLLRHGASVHLKDNDGRTALGVARDMNNIAILGLLVTAAEGGAGHGLSLALAQPPARHKPMLY